VILSADGQSVLIAKRGANQHQGNMWEFPGGKLEPGELPLQALCRELREEIGIEVKRSKHLLDLEHRYVDKAVRLYVFVVEQFLGEPQSLEAQPLLWVCRTKLKNYQFPQANQPIVEALLHRD